MTATQTFTTPAFLALLGTRVTAQQVGAIADELKRVGSVTVDIDEDAKRVHVLLNGTIVVKGSRMIELGESAAQADHGAQRAYLAGFGGVGF